LSCCTAGVLVEQVLAVDLVADDLRANKVLRVEAETHLLENVVGLLDAIHGTKRLDLHDAQRGGGGGNVALALLNASESARESSTLDLDVDFALGDFDQRVDQRALGGAFEALNKLHCSLNHFLHSLKSNL
jgi:hypothetical protein